MPVSGKTLTCKTWLLSKATETPSPVVPEVPSSNFNGFVQESTNGTWYLS